MKRKVLLLEPDYKNKYPPMGLMKLATYYRRRGDCVRFYKGDLRDLAVENIFEKFWMKHGSSALYRQVENIKQHIKTGKLVFLNTIDDPNIKLEIKMCRSRYKDGKWQTYDVVCVTTLFTFYWDLTIDTINNAKAFLKKKGSILVGGIAASILQDEMEKATGIRPLKGLLDQPGMIDPDSTVIIDDLPLDYSILDEIDYPYPSANAYFGYMTRGCPRDCDFCSVNILEPKYRDYISIREQMANVAERFGERRDLLLLDNNVLVSKCFDKIIDDIKDMGFAKGATYIPPDEYAVTLRNLHSKFNIRANLRKMIKLYDALAVKLDDETLGKLFIERETTGLLRYETATIKAVKALDTIVSPLFAKHFKRNELIRHVDFNQGIDARLLTAKKAKRLAEINIRPLRIAFDEWALRDKYEKAVRFAAKVGITNLSNYLLYNSDTEGDTPLNLYRRMRLNVDLCEELGVAIYSFPMKFHPIDNPAYFSNRDYIGKQWNRQYIRSIQAVLNSTHGKIGRGMSFFNEAFGANEEEFRKILIMPEALIIHRMKYKENITAEWWMKWSSLSDEQQALAMPIISAYDFTDSVVNSISDSDVRDVLRFYQIRRDR
jgi:hypothetical protein